MGPLGVLFIEDQRTAPRGRYTNRVTKAQLPNGHGVIWLIGASFLGPRILRLGSIHFFNFSRVMIFVRVKPPESFIFSMLQSSYGIFRQVVQMPLLPLLSFLYL